MPAMAGVLLPMQQSHVKAAKPAAPATEQVCSDAVTQATRTYTVRAGGMLSSTAERFSGNAVGRHWIYTANQSKIANPDLILIVWQLVIPYVAISSATAPMARTSASAASSEPNP